MKKVLVGGVFSILHPGHVAFLKKAKRYGDKLIVIVASDKTAKKKGKNIFSAKERAEIIASLKFVDKVYIGDSEDRTKLLKRIRPDVIVLGYDQRLDDKMLKIVRDLGCKIVKIKKLTKHSSTKIIKKIRKG